MAICLLVRKVCLSLILTSFSINASAQKEADFNKALAITLAKECGYINNRKVSGGETYCGITRKTHPQWDGWPTLDKQHPKPKRDEILPQLNQSVASFYRTHYWDKIRGDEIHSQQIANQFFDAAVRRGLDRAIMNQESKHGLKRTGTVSDELINAINRRH